MWLYILIFLVVLLGFNRPEFAKSKPFLMGFMAFAAIFVGFGDMLGGYDRYIYTELFDCLYNDRVGGFSVKDSPIWGYQKEFGYVFINYLISFITANRYIFILLLTCLIYTLIYFSFKEYMENYPIAVLLFLALIFFFTFTYLREVVGMSFAWLAYKHVYDRNVKKFLLFVGAAFTCHNSAVILLPMWFIPVHKFKKETVINVMVVLFLIGLTPIPTSLFTAYSAVAGDGGRSASYQGDFDAGTFRFEYIIEAVFFLYIILNNYNKIPETNKGIVFCNTAIVFCGILMFFVRSSNGGRLSWYYMVGVIATLTYLMSKVSISRKLKQYMIIVCFLLFFRTVYNWGILLSPYKTFLTDGHREGDPVFEKFEYDEKYDADKFYRPAFVLFGGE